MKNNRLVFILFITVIGLVLRYSSQPKPFERIREDISQIFGKSSRKDTEASEPSSNRKKSSTPADTDYDTEASDTQEPTTQASTTLKPMDYYLPAYTKADQIVRHRGYILNYVEKYEQPSWVLHLLLDLKGSASRSDKFLPDPLVKTGSALPSDYTSSGYDRGHLAPAGDFNYDQQLKYDSFYMSNMSPQDHGLNTGLWNTIEQRVRSWTKQRGDLVIVTGPVLRDGLPTIGRVNQIAVPEAYYKIVYDPHQQQAIAFLVDNKAWVNVVIDEFTVTIDEVEEKTGIDFFAKLPPGLQKNIESQNDTKAWFGRGKRTSRN